MDVSVAYFSTFVRMLNVRTTTPYNHQSISHNASAWPRGTHRKRKLVALTLPRCCALGWLTIRRLWIMAASKPVEPQVGTGLPRWQLALLVGTPIVLGAGAFYFWNRSRTKEGKGAGERKTPEGSASPVQGQDGAARTNREQENVVILPVHLVPSFYITLCPRFDTVCRIKLRAIFLRKHVISVKEFSRTLDVATRVWQLTSPHKIKANTGSHCCRISL